jgi:hypothetical protein
MKDARKGMVEFKEDILDAVTCITAALNEREFEDDLV